MEHITTDKLTQEIAYSSSEVAEMLDVSTSSLRKYCPALESAGYNIIRNKHENRVFTQRDVETLRQMRELVSNGLKIDVAVRFIMERPTPEPQTPFVIPDNVDRVCEIMETKSNEIIESMKIEQNKLIDKLEEVEKNNAELHEKLDRIADKQNQSLFKRLFKL